MKQLTDAERQRLGSALHARGVLPDCPACQQGKLGLGSLYTFIPTSTDPNTATTIADGRSGGMARFGMMQCLNCGYTQFHQLLTLGLVT